MSDEIVIIVGALALFGFFGFLAYLIWNQTQNQSQGVSLNEIKRLI